MTTRPVAVTGLGMITALGKGLDVNWRRLTSGHSGVHRICRFDTMGLPTSYAACVDFLDLPSESTIEDRTITMGDLAVDEALTQAGIALQEKPAFFIAPPIFEIDWTQLMTIAGRAGSPTYAAVFNEIRQNSPNLKRSDLTIPLHYALRHNLSTLPMCVTTACSGSATAIQFAVEAIQRKETRVAVVLGADSDVRPEMIARFSRLSALSEAKQSQAAGSRPFSKDRGGIVLGEGAGAIVLEDAEHARSRGSKILAYVLGIGEVSDNFHRTRMDPSAVPAAECMRAAIRRASITIEDVDYICAHGLGTADGDLIEAAAVNTVFGGRARPVPISSIKSMIGHTLAAAGILNAISAVLAIHTKRLPPTINHTPDPALRVDVVSNECREADIRVALSNAFGFGGQNVCIVLGRAGR